MGILVQDLRLVLLRGGTSRNANQKLKTCDIKGPVLHGIVQKRKRHGKKMLVNGTHKRRSISRPYGRNIGRLSSLHWKIMTGSSIHWRHMTAMASQINGNSIVCSNVSSGTHKSKHQARRHWPLWGNPLVIGGFPSQRASYAKSSHFMTSSCYRGFAACEWTLFGLKGISVQHVSTDIRRPDQNRRHFSGDSCA